jgi:hypothetical protein
MTDARVSGALEYIDEQIKGHQEKIRRLKMTANDMASEAGLSPPYSDIEAADAKTGTSRVRADQFANYAAPSSAARAFLEWRTKDKGAASGEEIFEALRTGGFPIDADGLGGLRIALAKDRAVVRLQNGTYGLAEWYPQLKQAVASMQRTKGAQKGKAAGDAGKVVGTEADETADAEGE